MDAKADYLFEVSWEVCNKVGGIYTVVKSKAAQILKFYDGRYFLIGPYFPQKAFGEFTEELPPEQIKAVFDKLKNEGIICHFGKWHIDGMPNAILIDFAGFTGRKNEIKTELWNNYKIDSLTTEYFSFDEPVIWSYAAGRLIEELSNAFPGKSFVAQFHEWLSGAGLLYLKSRKAKVATVFTTHATMLGRTIASSAELYDILDKIEPDAEAYKYNVHAKHQTEKACAANSDVFTTVSEITAIEATRLLNKKPDVLLPNGLNLKKFPTFEEASIRHHLYKRKIKDFIMFYFFPFYTFDLDETLIYFLSGRYEFHDKGVDVFIKALGRLNKQLKDEKSGKTIVAFFWIPGNIRGIKPELLENKTFFEDVREIVHDNIEDFKEKITYALITKKACDERLLFGEELLEEVNRRLLRFPKKGNPALTTHNLYDEDKDLILNAFRQSGLNNEKDDKVKVVFYPIYLTGADGLLDLSYAESMEGSHLGVFPSFYEPWGYTPLESGALGVPSITTDLAGFGRYVCLKCQQKKNPGVFVLKRMNRKEDEVVYDLADKMHYFANLPKEERIKNKIEAKRLSALADWELLVENYIKAHNLAVKKVFG